MKMFLAKAALAAMLAAGSLAGTVAPAAAQVDIIIGGPDRRPPPRAEYGRPPPPPLYGSRRGCDPQTAEDIARDNGFRRTRVIEASPRRVVVQGWTRRGPDEMSFANVRGCPVLRR